MRRLHDKGNEFVVKRLVKKEGGSAEEALNKLKEMAIIPQNKTDKQKQITSGLFNKLKTASQSTKSRQSQSCTTTITTTTSSEVVHNEYSVDAHLDGPPAMLDHSSALSSTTCDRQSTLPIHVACPRCLSIFPVHDARPHSPSMLPPSTPLAPALRSQPCPRCCQRCLPTLLTSCLAGVSVLPTEEPGSRQRSGGDGRSLRLRRAQSQPMGWS